MPSDLGIYLFEIERLSTSADEFNFKVKGYKAIQAISVDAAYSELRELDIMKDDLINCMWTGSFTLGDYLPRVQFALEQQKRLEELYIAGKHVEVINLIKFLMSYGYRPALNEKKDGYLVFPLFDTTFQLKEE